MKIDLAVYTATLGFGWQDGSAYPIGLLLAYQERIGEFPDALDSEIPYGGMFVHDGRLVFYRFHIFRHGDARGRDAFYCVLGSVALTEVRRIDIEEVFRTSAFSCPQRPIPVAVEVPECEMSTPTARDQCERILQSRDSIREIAWVAPCYERGTFFCRLGGDLENPVVQIEASNPTFPPAPGEENARKDAVAVAQDDACGRTGALPAGTPDGSASPDGGPCPAGCPAVAELERQVSVLQWIVALLAVLVAALLSFNVVQIVLDHTQIAPSDGAFRKEGW